MKFSFRLCISLLLSVFMLNAYTANEWKNPDETAQPKLRPKPVAPAPAPVRKSAPAPIKKTASAAVLLEGQLGLQAQRVCNYQLAYTDKGSGGKIDGSFYIPSAPAGYAMIGAYAQGNYKNPSDCILTVQAINEESNSLLQIPDSWQRVWTDKGSGANMDGSIWHPTTQNNDYICLGSVAVEGYKQPNLSNYVCVHQCLVEKNPSNYPVWSTKGTGAKQKAYMYKLHNSNSFFAVPGKVRPEYLLDLKGDLNCKF